MTTIDFQSRTKFALLATGVFLAAGALTGLEPTWTAPVGAALGSLIIDDQKKLIRSGRLYGMATLAAAAFLGMSGGDKIHQVVTSPQTQQTKTVQQNVPIRSSGTREARPDALKA